MHHSKIKSGKISSSACAKATAGKPVGMSSSGASRQLFKIQRQVLAEVRIYLMAHRREVLKIPIIDHRTKIAGEFFDDWLGERVVAYIPIELKNILSLCLEEPNIIAEISRTNSSEATTLGLIKDAVRFYLKDYVYGKVGSLKDSLLS